MFKQFRKIRIERELKRICAFWSQLESLTIRQFSGLSMKEMEDLFPRLRQLEKVVLPQRIASCHVLLYESMKYELRNRMPPGDASFKDFYEGENCILNI